jgi:hypothetical protein
MIKSTGQSKTEVVALALKQNNFKMCCLFVCEGVADKN